MSEEQYDKVCKDRLDKIEGMISEMHKAMFESNGKRALVIQVADNTEWRKRMDATFKKAIMWIVAAIAGGHGLDKLITMFINQQ
jgi:hypothetical protein